MLCTCMSQQSVMYINVKTKRYIRVRYRIGVTYNLMSYNLRFVHAYVTQSRLKFTSRFARYVQACDTIIRATYRIATPLYALHTSLRHHYTRYIQACDTIIRATYKLATPLYALHTSLRHHYTRYIQACDTIIRATYKLTVPF